MFFETKKVRTRISADLQTVKYRPIYRSVSSTNVKTRERGKAQNPRTRFNKFFVLAVSYNAIYKFLTFFTITHLVFLLQ